MINGNISFFLNSCVPPCNSDSEKNTTDPHNKMGLGEKRQVSSKKIKKREKAKKKTKIYEVFMSMNYHSFSL